MYWVGSAPEVISVATAIAPESDASCESGKSSGESVISAPEEIFLMSNAVFVYS